MRNLMLLSLFFILSCSTRKNDNINQITQNISPQLTQEEINVTNDFLDAELAAERYKYYRKLGLVLIEDAGNGTRNLLVYEYAYKDWHSFGENGTLQDNERLGWILDTIRVKELKNKYLNVENYNWKISDIKNFNISTIKNKTLINIIKSGEYINLPEKLIIYLTKPLIVDKNNAFISLNIGSSRLGFTSMNHYTALLKKANDKWVISASYDDGVYY
jgi:hypothetical protein